MNKILLPESEVPLGAIVQAVLPGKTEPEVEGDDVVPPLKVLADRRSEKVFCPLPQVEAAAKTGVADVTKMTGFAAGVRFLPQNCFTPGEAPVGTEYAVIVGERRLLYSDLGHPFANATRKQVQIYLHTNRRFYYMHSGGPRDAEVPADGILIAVSEVSKGNKPHYLRQ